MRNMKNLRRLAIVAAASVCIFSVYIGITTAAGELWDLSVTKSLTTVGTIFSGDTVTYEIQVTNTTTSGG